MEHVYFNEANKDLLRPSNMTDEECKTLPVFTDGHTCISKWKMSWLERLHCLFRGYVWVYVRSGATQPPICITAEKTAFETEATT